MRQPPKLLFTIEEWTQVPPDARFEAGGRRFTYHARRVDRGAGLPPVQERILYEVELVERPVPNHGLPGGA